MRAVSFRRDRRRRVVLRLSDHEVALLRDLLAQLVELVEAPGHDTGDDLAAMVGIGTSTHAPADPALARLLPDAYPDDAVAAGDFRRYTEDRLRRRKAEHAAGAVATLDAGLPATLDPAAAQAWLGALNDLRLVVGTRLDVQEDDDPERWVGTPEEPTYVVYWWLSTLQGDLLDALG